jgi:hypothetical protein
MSLIGMIFYRSQQGQIVALRIWLSDAALDSRMIWPSRNSWDGPVLIDTRTEERLRKHATVTGIFVLPKFNRQPDRSDSSQ